MIIYFNKVTGESLLNVLRPPLRSSRSLGGAGCPWAAPFDLKIAMDNCPDPQRLPVAQGESSTDHD